MIFLNANWLREDILLDLRIKVGSRSYFFKETNYFSFLGQMDAWANGGSSLLEKTWWIIVSNNRDHLCGKLVCRRLIKTNKNKYNLQFSVRVSIKSFFQSFHHIFHQSVHQVSIIVSKQQRNHLCHQLVCRKLSKKKQVKIPS